VNAALVNTGLHDITRTRLQRELVSVAPVKEGALDATAFAATISEAITAAQAEYAAISGGSGRIVGMGGGIAPSEISEADRKARLQDAFSGVFGLSEAAAAVAAKGR
jgi:hypothetical protein